MLNLLLLVLSLNVTETRAAGYYATSEEDCKTLDLRETFPLKMRNQHHMSWCFAHTSADYLQYTYHLTEQISAADIAVNYSKSKWSRFLHFFKRMFDRDARREPAQTGLIKYATQMIIPQGYCPETAFPSETWTKVSQSGEKLEVEILTATLDIFSLQKKILKGTYESAADLPYFYQFKHIDQNKFYDLLQDNPKRKLLEAFRLSACEGERKPFPDSIGVKMRVRSSHMFEHMNDSFDEKMPVSIDFFSRVLKNLDGPLSLKGFHTVLLYGRKFDQERNECRYLLKNSYGESCDTYDPKLNCEKGYLWIPESGLHRTMSSYVVLQH